MESFELDIDGTEFTSSRIYKAIKAQNHYRVLSAIHRGENVHLRDQEFTSTYLHFIVNIADSTTEEKYVPMVYQLSNAGIDVNAVDYKGRTALELAIFRELIELMVALMRVGTDACAKDYKAMIRDYGSPFEYEILNTFEKYEPGMWNCIRHNDTGMVYMMVNSWCRVNINQNNQTLLQQAKETHKSEDMIVTLEDYEVTLEFVHATLAGDEKRMLEFLMDSKPCDPNIMDISYQERWSQPLTPRSLRDTAIAMGHTHVLHLLPESDSDNEGHAQGHKHQKDCSATVMGMTSIAELPPISETFPEEDDSGHDNQDSTYDDLYDYQYFRPAKFKNNGVHQPGNSAPPRKHQPPPLLPKQTASYSTGANGPLKIEQKCYYFHEVDNFASQNYYDPESMYATPQKAASIRRSGRLSSRSAKYDYSHNWKAINTKSGHEKRSKMCVIS